MTTRVSYSPPSAIARAALSLVLLLGFYVVILGLAALLFAAPIALLVAGTGFHWAIVPALGLCWTPAGLLVRSALSTRRPKFVPPPRQLAESEAPALFAAVRDLAGQAGTAPPGEIYLDCLPNLAVVEVGGLFKTRRVMIIGVPLIGFLTGDELRAGIAHELGHFIGGDTRLTTFSVQTHALFSSVLETTERDPLRVDTTHYAIEVGLSFAQAIGNILVRNYGRFYLRITRSISRRQEFAADALSAALVGVPATARALERMAINAPFYNLYLERDVLYAVRHGAMPTDLLLGFEWKRRRVFAEHGREIAERTRATVTDPYDTHPALSDRLRALEAFPSGGGMGDQRRAWVLFGDVDAIDAWLVQATREGMIQAVTASNGKVGTLRELSWALIPNEVYAPGVTASAQRIVERIHSQFPNVTTLGGMFAAVLRHLTPDNQIDFAAHLMPAIRGLPPEAIEREAIEACRDALGTLFMGALIERGATAERSPGPAEFILRLENERIDAREIMRPFGENGEGSRAGLDRWAERLERARG